VWRGVLGGLTLAAGVSDSGVWGRVLSAP